MPTLRILLLLFLNPNIVSRDNLITLLQMSALKLLNLRTNMAYEQTTIPAQQYTQQLLILTVLS